MARPQEHLADALEILKALQVKGVVAIRSKDLGRLQRDAMAARGYLLAFNAVKSSVEKILNKENPAEVTAEDHGNWYRALFGPSVEAGKMIVQKQKRPFDEGQFLNWTAY